MIRMTGIITVTNYLPFVGYLEYDSEHRWVKYVQLHGWHCWSDILSGRLTIPGAVRYTWSFRQGSSVLFLYKHFAISIIPDTILGKMEVSWPLELP